MSASVCYNPHPMRLFEADGDFASGALAYFYAAGTTTPMIVYGDGLLANVHPWPVPADAYGLLPPIYIPKGEDYKVRIVDAQGDLLYAADEIGNPTEVETGGGIEVTAPMIHTTGDVKWRPSSGSLAGWVRMNNKTISSAAGDGTERQNDDCEDLFLHLWNNFPQGLAAVVGGRGVSATSDWTDDKEIWVLDMRGIAPFGVDDMGNDAVGRLQLTGTLTTTNGSPNATYTITSPSIPASTYYFYVPRNTYIDCVNVPSLAGSPAYVTTNTTVYNVGGDGYATSPATLTMSVNATVTGTAAVTFSPVWPNGITAGAAGGNWILNLETKQLPPHMHGDGTPYVQYYGGATTPTGTTVPLNLRNDASLYTGEGKSFYAQPFTRLGTFYMKL